MKKFITIIKSFWKWFKKDWPRDNDKHDDGQDIADRTW
jgi:hypothetical protein